MLRTVIWWRDGIECTAIEDIEPGPDYFLDLYGSCSMFKNGKPYCFCNDAKAGGSWIGRRCHWFKTLGVKSHKELADNFLKHH
jgi:uncharacterized protein YodC (DUF2158 family)